MSQPQAAAAVDRLPWLEDEPKPAPVRSQRARSSSREIAGWAVALILVVAGISYWLGVHSWRPSTGEVPPKAAKVSVPQPRSAEPAPIQQQSQPQVVLEPEPEAAPAPFRDVRIARPRLERRSFSRHVLARRPVRPATLEKVVTAQKAAPPKATNPDSGPLLLWPASQSAGARGRIVRIGAFGSRQQAKLGWRHMVRAYPAVAHLPATVVEDRNSRGRTFYRFQIGTTSQAHSEVLCQRMGRIRFSCAVVGLPWKPRGVER